MLNDLLMLGLHSGARGAFAYPAEEGYIFGLGAQVGSCWLIFRMFWAFLEIVGRILRHHCFYDRFFSNVHRFLMDW